MNVLEAIKARRAVKHFDENYEMPREHTQLMIEHTLESPTSFNIQHWRIINVENSLLRQQVREAAWDQAQITDASLLFVLCADIKAWDKQPEQYWKNAPQAAQDVLVPMIKPFYEGSEQLQRDEAVRSIGIAAQTLMLTAKALGYDSCPMIGFDNGKVAEIIKLPSDHLIGMIITVGKATQPAWPKPGQLSQDKVVLKDTF